MTTENGLPRMAHVRRNIEALRDRLGYLIEKQEQRAYEGRGPDVHVATEILALTWALPVLETEWDSLARLRTFIMRTEGRSEVQIADHERQWEETKTRVVERVARHDT